MVCICTALSIKLQSEDAGTYAHFEFIYISNVKSLFIGRFSKLIYHDILNCDINIRKV